MDRYIIIYLLCYFLTLIGSTGRDIIIYLLCSFLTLIRSMDRDIIIYLLCSFLILIESTNRDIIIFLLWFRSLIESADPLYLTPFLAACRGMDCSCLSESMVCRTRNGQKGDFIYPT
jgi:hypothetical protein